MMDDDFDPDAAEPEGMKTPDLRSVDLKKLTDQFDDEGALAGGEKVGKKKLAKLQAKAQAKAQREAVCLCADVCL